MRQVFTWKSDNENRSVVKIISDKELDPTSMMTITGTATINLRFRVNHQPVINLLKLLKLKHNQSK
jgi:hypothetical protein